MNIERVRPEAFSQNLGLPTRSEAFAEDLDGLLPQAQATSKPAGRTGRPGRSLWVMLLLPLAVVLIGSASALAWI
jgi:hypothetical protein